MTKPGAIIISYYFPPSPAIGGQRIYRIAKFFQRKEVRTSIITGPWAWGKNKCQLSFDAERYPDQLNVYYVAPIINNPVRGIPSTVENLYYSNFSPRIGSTSERDSNSLLERAVKVLRMMRDIFIFPDAMNLWISTSYLKARKVAQGQKFNFLFTSSPPNSCHVVGLMLKRKFPGLFWIADFRDPWIYNLSLNNVVSIAHRKLFETVIRHADAVTVTTEPMRDLFTKILGYKFRAKIFILFNGIELDLFKNVKPKVISTKKIIFAHFGDLDYGHRNPDALLRAFYSIIADDEALRDTFEVHFWGDSGQWQGRTLSDMIREYCLNGIVFDHPRVSRQEALSLMKGVDVLILLAEDQPLQIPAKTYEYLLSGTPILALVDQGSATYQLVKRFQNVLCVSKKNEQEIKVALRNLLEIYRNNSKDLITMNHVREVSQLSFDFHLEKLLEDIRSYGVYLQ